MIQSRDLIMEILLVFERFLILGANPLQNIAEVDCVKGIA